MRFSHRILALARAVPSPDIRQSARPWVWLAAIEGFWNSSDQNKAHGSKAKAVDDILSQYGH